MTLSVREFAELEQMTVQGIYKRLNTSLAKYKTVSTVNGKQNISIDSSGLSAEGQKRLLKKLSTVDTNSEIFEDCVDNDAVNTPSELEFLRIQLVEKDEQIKRLTEEISRLTGLLESSQRLMENSQLLQAQSIRMLEPSKSAFQKWKDAVFHGIPTNQQYREN